MDQTPQPVHEEQRPGDRFRQDIDLAYSNASFNAAALMSDIQFRKLVHKKMYLEFYQAFSWLFLQTSPLKLVSSEQRLIRQIQEWLVSGMGNDQYGGIPIDRAWLGISLFFQWSSILDAKGIHTLNP